MSWQDTLNVTAPGYNMTCEQLFVTPIPDIAGTGVRISIYAQTFLALLCLTFSSTEDFTNAIRGASATTFLALTITSLLFLFGNPNGENLIGLGRLRVVLALSTISYGPAFLNIYRSYENEYFAPLKTKAEEEKIKLDPSLNANNRIANIIISPFVLLVWLGIFAAAILFGVCVSRLGGPTVEKAAHFCGFETIAMTPGEAVGWCFLSLVIPWSLPFFPAIMMALYKTDSVDSWRAHVRNKALTGLIGKFAYWGYTITLCGLTERFINEDPATFVPGNDELKWTFGQILPIVMLITLFAVVARHMGKMPSYPLPEYQPAHSRFTFYVHMLCNYHCLWANLRQFMRLSETTFLHGEHKLWILAGSTAEKVMQRKRTICKIQIEIRKYIDNDQVASTPKQNSLENDLGIGRIDLRYMDSALEVLQLAGTPKAVRKIKSYPVMSRAVTESDIRVRNENSEMGIE